jgi:hypothetical protein
VLICAKAFQYFMMTSLTFKALIDAHALLAGGGKPSRVPISALTRKANHGGGRGGVLGYLNELLISK